MEKLIFVRYGEHENGHLNESGKQMMFLVSEKLKPILENKKASIICAKVPRAIESAEIIAKNISVDSVESFQELYAAPEEGIQINLEVAKKVIAMAGDGSDVVIAIISREYIEALPGYIFKNVSEKIHLDRGEMLTLDYDIKKLKYA